MLARATRCLGVLSVLLLLSCAQLPQALPEGQGALTSVSAKDLTSVPPEWGNLVSVTTTTKGDNAGIYFQLWFQDGDGTIRLLSLDPQTNRFIATAGLIRRK
jgi:hypothetical protein